MAGLYFHIPFCKKACHYCDFHFSTTVKNKPDMVTAIMSEMVLRQNELEGENIETIYFGGGTPSLLSKEELTSIFNKINELFTVVDNAEITLEANPDDLTTQKLLELKSLGVNRLSIGIQSFFDEHLVWMNRAHSASESIICVREAQKIGFENITVDLIYGIPMMSDEQWLHNVRTAIELGVPHISAYNLTVESKTALAHQVREGKSPDVNDEQGERNFKVLKDQLEKTGFVQYEISNFGKDDYFSKHNTSYWLGKKYLGLGPSAHSFDGSSRKWNISNNSIYIRTIMDGKLPLEVEVLTPVDQVNEHLMIGLRNIWGCDWDYLYSTGIDLTQLKTEVVSKINTGYLEKTDKGFKTTAMGLLFADAIASDLFVD